MLTGRAWSNDPITKEYIHKIGMDELKNIGCSQELLKKYIQKIKNLDTQNKLGGRLDEVEKELQARFNKTTELFQKGSVGRQLIRRAIVDLNATSWKRNVKNFINELKVRVPAKVATKPDASNEMKHKIEKHIKKLEIMLKKIRSQVRKLEETEIDFNEEGHEETYILEDKLKRKAASIYLTIKKLRNEKISLARSREQHIAVKESPVHPELSKMVQKFVNKCEDMPDIEDYHNIIKEYNTRNPEKKADVGKYGRHFVEVVGNEWQKRRLKDFREDFFAKNTDDIPDDALSRKLNENEKKAKAQLTEKINEFAAKQERIELGEKSLSSEEEEEDEVEEEDSVKVAELNNDELLKTEFEIVGIESDYDESESDDEVVSEGDSSSSECEVDSEEDLVGIDIVNNKNTGKTNGFESKNDVTGTSKNGTENGTKTASTDSSNRSKQNEKINSSIAKTISSDISDTKYNGLLSPKFSQKSMKPAGESIRNDPKMDLNENDIKKLLITKKPTVKAEIMTTSVNDQHKIDLERVKSKYLNKLETILKSTKYEASLKASIKFFEDQITKRRPEEYRQCIIIVDESMPSLTLDTWKRNLRNITDKFKTLRGTDGVLLNTGTYIKEVLDSPTSIKRNATNELKTLPNEIAIKSPPPKRTKITPTIPILFAQKKKTVNIAANDPIVIDSD